MSTKPTKAPKLWSREPPERTGPIRHSGGFYRTAEGKDRVTGGVPLHNVNDAVVAAVRLAYKVAENQIDRSTRLARRLRDAGDRAVGPGSDRKAVDATERLVMKTLMSGLEWWEGSVAEGRCPVKRLAAAEYQMLGTILGLGPSPQTKPAQGGTRERNSVAEDSPRKEVTAVPRQLVAVPKLLIVHASPENGRRPVEIERWEIARPDAFKTTVFFFSVAAPTEKPIQADLVLNGGNADAHLTVATPPAAMGGRWKCAICDPSGVQLGFIEIALT